MVIVGGGAALTAIATYLAWLSLRSLRAAWRARQAERRRHQAHADFHPAPGE
jgi:threonine/homoserine/homoserine lactone efflux protein